MNFENNNMDFSKEDYDAEKKQHEQYHAKKDERMARHPLFIQAQEIADITTALIQSIADDRERALYEATLTESARTLAPKISGVLYSSSWLLSMQHAAIVRYHAEYLLSSTSGLKMLNSVDPRYVKLLRDEMLIFRELFKKWCAKINDMNKDEYDDDWGLFSKH
jgi:hypothetical protein